MRLGELGKSGGTLAPAASGRGNRPFSVAVCAVRAFGQLGGFHTAAPRRAR
jgi:hypothetical protein